jgi:hypothetical protein
LVNAPESFSAMTMLLALNLIKRFSAFVGWQSVSYAYAIAA